MKTETRYIQFILPGSNFESKVAELDSEYEIGLEKISMVAFYAANGRLWCIETNQIKIITEKEFFKARLLGKDIFEDV